MRRCKDVHADVTRGARIITGQRRVSFQEGNYNIHKKESDCATWPSRVLALWARKDKVDIRTHLCIIEGDRAHKENIDLCNSKLEGHVAPRNV